MEYVLGFIFDSSFKKVLLINKNRPDWQKGKINGIGGKIERNETPKAAISREVLEETRLVIQKKEWKEMGVHKGKDWNVYIFTTVYKYNPSDAQTMTDEKIAWYSISRLPNTIISNLTWFIPLCKDSLIHNTPKKIIITH